MKKVITYEAPDVTVFKIQSEGTLCGSVDGDFNPNDLTNGQSGWFESEE
ncbi:MAG: hypothetical protein PUF62_06630 [Bacteroidales bacterium]|nr:hypothetical protein [Bacteroidales bacterium]